MKAHSFAVFVFSAALSFYSAEMPAAHALQSTLEDQKGVELTVYNSNLGLVKDLRTVNLPKGEGELRFMDVASNINPVTVAVKSLTAASEFSVLDQNYEYDLMNDDAILNKYVGKKVKLLNWDQNFNKKETVEATLLSNNGGQVYQIGNEIYLGYPGTRILPSLPENLIAKPTLTWNFLNKSAKPHQLEVSYLTGGIGWKADYIVTLGKDDTSLDLSGWVSIDNQSGAAYKNARLKLVAGDVNRVQENYGMPRMMAMKGAVAMDMAVPQFEEKTFFEYHIYDLQRKVTVKDRQTKQISLLEAQGVSAQKEMLIYGSSNYYMYGMPGQTQKQDVNVFIKFKNSKENRAGMPLPEGILRVYKKDSDGSLQFVGEDRIDHTPKNEEVRIKIGKAFDVTSHRRQLDYARLSDRVHESEWEVIVRNHKQEEVSVSLLEPIHAEWKVIKNSHPYQKADAGTLRFDLKIPKDGEVKLTYRVRVTA